MHNGTNRSRSPIGDLRTISHFGIPPPFPPFLSAHPISIVSAVVATSLKRTFSHHDSSPKFSDWFTLEQVTGHCLVVVIYEARRAALS